MPDYGCSVNARTEEMIESFAAWPDHNTLWEFGFNQHSYDFWKTIILLTIKNFAVMLQEVTSCHFLVLPLHCHLQSAFRVTLY